MASKRMTYDFRPGDLVATRGLALYMTVLKSVPFPGPIVGMPKELVAHNTLGVVFAVIKGSFRIYVKFFNGCEGWYQTDVMNEKAWLELVGRQ